MDDRDTKEKVIHAENADGYTSSDADRAKEGNIEKAPGDMTLDESLNDWDKKEESKLVYVTTYPHHHHHF